MSLSQPNLPSSIGSSNRDERLITPDSAMASLGQVNEMQAQVGDNTAQVAAGVEMVVNIGLSLLSIIPGGGAVKGVKDGIKTAKEGVEVVKKGVEVAKEGLKVAKAAGEGINAAKETLKATRGALSTAREGVRIAKETSKGFKTVTKIGKWTKVGANMTANGGRAYAAVQRRDTGGAASAVLSGADTGVKATASEVKEHRSKQA